MARNRNATDGTDDSGSIDARLTSDPSASLDVTPDFVGEPATGSQAEYERDSDRGLSSASDRGTALDVTMGYQDSASNLAHSLDASPDNAPDQHARRASEIDVRRRTNRMIVTSNGRMREMDIASGFTWAVQEQQGLATDMHVRSVSVGLWMVSVRQASSDAWIELEDGIRLPLSQIEIPWRGELMVNGSVRYEVPSRPPATFTIVDRPNQSNTLCVAVGQDCIAVTDDQPHLARTAAHLFVPGGQHALLSWAERLDAYRISLGYRDSHAVSLIALDLHRLVIIGNSVVEVGVGQSLNTVPTYVLRTVNSRGGDLLLDTEPVELQTSGSDVKIWVPGNSSDDRWLEDSYVLAYRGSPQLAAGSISLA